MEARPTSLPGVVEFQPRRFTDDRGWFSESWNAKAFAEHGVDLTWVQDNESLSSDAGTIRGIHFQTEPFAQYKLVRAVRGRIFDVAIDLRRSSETFMQWVATELNSEVGNQLLIPAGFGHAFCTLTDDCHVAYKVTAHYAPETERSIAWNDPELAIGWPVAETDVSLSAKDRAAPTMADSIAELFA